MALREPPEPSRSVRMESLVWKQRRKIEKLKQSLQDAELALLALEREAERVRKGAA